MTDETLQSNIIKCTRTQIYTTNLNISKDVNKKNKQTKIPKTIIHIQLFVIIIIIIQKKKKKKI